MATPQSLTLQSGLIINNPLVKLRSFCAEEYSYYDALPDGSPYTIEPIDVTVTVAMNSFVNSATRIRQVHRGLAEACTGLLAAIPPDADLRYFGLGKLIELLDAACRVRGVLMAVATKVLHRKRRHLVPMLDSVLIDSYLAALGPVSPRSAFEEGHRAAEGVRPLLEAFRIDLEGAFQELESLGAILKEDGYRMTPLRILEVSLWMENEPVGYYR